MIPTNTPDLRSLRLWFALALLISLGIHLFLYRYAMEKKLAFFHEALAVPTPPPRPVSVKKVILETAAAVPAPTPPKAAPARPAFAQNSRPREEQPASDIVLTPQAPAVTDLAQRLAAERPQVESSRLPSADRSTGARVEEAANDIREKIGSTNFQRIAPGAGVPMPRGGGEGTPGFSNLDDLLAQSGPLSGKVAPVNMPGGALFEYNSAELLPEALATLGKLGDLIRRNPRATFSIEGHSDSFGTDEYNFRLSQERAEAVKAWLVGRMQIDPSKIQTKGLGSTRMIVPGSGSREEQAPNRRVEIVIRTPR